MGKPLLEPTGDNTFVVICGSQNDAINFGETLAESRRMEADGDFEGACNLRLHSFQQLLEIIPDEGDTVLEWEDRTSQDAITTGYWSGIDHFLIGDWEMAAAIFEMILEIDPEDHTEATIPLAYTYLAMEEYDSFDEIINDVNDKYIDKVILTLWNGFRREGELDKGEMVRFRGRFAPYYKEFTADLHPADEKYMKDISNENPSKETLARELWLQTEHLWNLFPGFIDALRVG